MRFTLILLSILSLNIAFAQSLPFYFESDITTTDFEDFDGGTASVIANPQVSGINTSANVAQIVRNGGAIWAGSKIQLAANLDFSVNNAITMKIYTTAPIGTVVKLKLEGTGSVERDVTTTTTSEWEELTWDFSGTPADFNYVVFMFDFGNTGDGSANSTFLFDDVSQVFNGWQIYLPVSFEEEQVNYTTTDFGGNQSSLVVDPEDTSNTVVKVIKTTGAATWAGTTIGTPAGFASYIPLSLSDSKMRVKVWSPDAGIAVRLKVEDANDPTHTCETQTLTTAANAWQVMEFDFTNEANGTAKLEFGLQNGWKYNMASIFFNFDVDGATAGEKTYYFDNVEFGSRTVGIKDNTISTISIAPNPATEFWTLTNLKEQSSVRIVDFYGALLYSNQSNEGSIKIDASSFASGTYILLIESSAGLEVHKINKN